MFCVYKGIYIDESGMKYFVVIEEFLLVMIWCMWKKVDKEVKLL